MRTPLIKRESAAKKQARITAEEAPFVAKTKVRKRFWFAVKFVIAGVFVAIACVIVAFGSLIGGLIYLGRNALPHSDEASRPVVNSSTPIASPLTTAHAESDAVKESAETSAALQIIRSDSVPQDLSAPTSQPPLHQDDVNAPPAQGTENAETQLTVGVGDMFQLIESKESVIFAYSDSDIEPFSTAIFANDFAAIAKLGEAEKVGSLDKRHILRVLEVRTNDDSRYSYVKCRILLEGQEVAEAYVIRPYFTARFLNRLHTEIAKQPQPVTPSPSPVVKTPAKTTLVPKKSAPTPNTRPKNEIITVPSSGRVWVDGYTRKNGTRVKGYWRSK